MESLNLVLRVPLAGLKVYRAMRTGPRIHVQVPKESIHFSLLLNSFCGQGSSTAFFIHGLV